MAKSKSSEKVLCSCGCKGHISQWTQTRHLQGNGPTLALAEMFETQNYFGATHSNPPRTVCLDEDVHPSKRRRIAVVDPMPSLTPPPPQPVPDLDPLLPPGTSAIDSDEILAGRWAGCGGVDADDDIEFEGDFIPQLMEVSDDEDEGSEVGSDDEWDNEIGEDLLEVLETNVELDNCGAGT